MTTIHESVFIAPGATVMGDIVIEENASVWFHTTIRAEHSSIHIGKCSNVQDNCVIHVSRDDSVTIGENVTIGHSAIVHGCTVGNNTMIGMGAILMNGASIGSNCIIGAGSLITRNTVIPDNSLVLGSPGKIIRTVTFQEIQANIVNAKMYVDEAQIYKISCTDSKF
jgi:carbonic anhydrase/acetyltransferase-like protein (isoleucine patch superfamily)